MGRWAVDILGRYRTCRRAGFTASTVLFGAVGAVAALLAVLVPVIRAQGAALRHEATPVAKARRDLR